MVTHYKNFYIFISDVRTNWSMKVMMRPSRVAWQLETYKRYTVVLPTIKCVILVHVLHYLSKGKAKISGHIFPTVLIQFSQFKGSSESPKVFLNKPVKVIGNVYDVFFSYVNSIKGEVNFTMQSWYLWLQKTFVSAMESVTNLKVST
jgi:hypothetical protein